MVIPGSTADRSRCGRPAAQADYDHLVALSAERIGGEAGLWTRSLVINVVAVVVCRYLFGGFEIHGVATYLVAALGIEAPTVAWWLAVQLFLAKGFDDRLVDSSFFVRLIWIALLLGLTIAIPVALATSAPGLVFAAWISSLTIKNASTYVGACAVTSALTIGLRSSRPLKFTRAFMKGDPEHPYRSPAALR